MIHSKLKKGKTSQLLVQFSRDNQVWSSVISKFYQTCKEQSVKINKSSSLKPNYLRFYTVEQNSQKILNQNSRQVVLDLNSVLKSQISQISLKFTVIYMNDESDIIPNYIQFISNQNSTPRVLLLRQTLIPHYDLNYDVQSTLSEQQSIIYLCDLAASLINSKNQGQIQQYHQKKQLMIRKGNQGQLSQTEVIWRNILFQVPGLGKDKVRVISENFPTYQKLIKDCDKQKKLKNIVVGRGTKGAKIGGAVADRLYKVFGSLNGKQKLY